MTTPTPVHLGTDEIQLVEQPTMLITIKGDIPPTLITSIVGPVAIYKNKPALIQSAADRPHEVHNHYQHPF